MRYAFDMFGWFDGERADDVMRRTTAVAPVNTSLTTTPGEMRSNWTGRVWEDRPYVARTLPTPPVWVPNEITMLQLREHLIDADLIDNLQAAFNALPAGKPKRKALAAFEYSRSVTRDGKLAQLMKNLLNLTNAQVDTIFIEAAKL